MAKKTEKKVEKANEANKETETQKTTKASTTKKAEPKTTAKATPKKATAKKTTKTAAAKKAKAEPKKAAAKKTTAKPAEAKKATKATKVAKPKKETKTATAPKTTKAKKATKTKATPKKATTAKAKPAKKAEKQLDVLHISVECYPVAKVGGLADVVGSLPKFQRKEGVNASVVMPWFDRPFVHENEFDVIVEDRFSQGAEILTYTIYKEKKDTLGFPLYLVKIPGKLDRPDVYGYGDESEQWIAFQHAVLHWTKYHRGAPDVFHCHDSHVGLIPFLTKYSHEYSVFHDVKTVYTVHNGQYQGWMDWNKAGLLPQFDGWKGGLMDWDGLINPLATAIKCCDAYTAVSEGYLGELPHNSNGLELLFQQEAGKGHGIVNGIDTAYWNPNKDKLVEKNYNVKTVNKGKQDNKEAILSKFNLSADLPLITFIGRFAGEKGADLLNEIIYKLFSRNQDKFTIFILGSGDKHVEWQMNELRDRFPERMGIYIGYNEGLAHQLYAASDMLLMPSRVEPCGLNQLYALKYGTVPIVRAVGGLRDTVIDVDQDQGYGYVFENVNTDEAVHAIERALEKYDTKRQWGVIRSRAMRLDFSWNKSAKKYIELYNQL